jgi:hypothetical protein
MSLANMDFIALEWDALMHMGQDIKGDKCMEVE